MRHTNFSLSFTDGREIDNSVYPAITDIGTLFSEDVLTQLHILTNTYADTLVSQGYLNA